MLSMCQIPNYIISFNFQISHLGFISVSHIQTLRLRLHHSPEVTVLLKGRIWGFRDCKTISKLLPEGGLSFNSQEHTGQTEYWTWRKMLCVIFHVRVFLFFLKYDSLPIYKVQMLHPLALPVFTLTFRFKFSLCDFLCLSLHLAFSFPSVPLIIPSLYSREFLFAFTLFYHKVIPSYLLLELNIK